MDHRSFRDQLTFAIGFAVSRSRGLLRVLRQHVSDDARRELCAGMRQEEHLSNGARVDCMTATHAIVEFSEKWAEGLGQALHYAATTGKRPAIFLVCRQAEHLCLAHALRLEEAIEFWRLPVEVWRR